MTTDFIRGYEQAREDAAQIAQNELDAAQRAERGMVKKFEIGAAYAALVIRDGIRALAPPPATTPADQCDVTCADYPLCDCLESHQCVLDKGHSFDPMYGEIHQFVTHMLPVKPRAQRPADLGAVTPEQDQGEVGSQFVNAETDPSHSQTAIPKDRVESAAHAQTDIDEFWLMLDRCFHIEPREYFEKKARVNGFKSPLAMACFYMWKREGKVGVNLLSDPITQDAASASAPSTTVPDHGQASLPEESCSPTPTESEEQSATPEENQDEG